MFFRAGLFRKRKCSRAVEQRYDFANRHGLFTVPRGMMMDRSRYALQPVYFVMFQLSILARMWGNLQYGMPARLQGRDMELRGSGRPSSAPWRFRSWSARRPVRMAWAGQRRTGSPTNPTATSFTKHPGSDRLDRTASQVSGPANWLASQPGGAGRRGRIRAGGCMMTGAAR